MGLTLAWFLSTSLKWGSEALESRSSYMHATVWTLSAIKTVLVIVFKKIGGDVLSGVCFVGLWDSGTLLYFVIIPLVLYHAIGIVMLAVGLCYSFRFKEELRKSGNKTDKFENLITRIGMSCGICILISESSVMICLLLMIDIKCSNYYESDA